MGVLQLLVPNYLSCDMNMFFTMWNKYIMHGTLVTQFASVNSESLLYIPCHAISVSYNETFLPQFIPQLVIMKLNFIRLGIVNHGK